MDPNVGGETSVAKSPAICAISVRVKRSFSGTNPVNDQAEPKYVIKLKRAAAAIQRQSAFRMSPTRST